MPIEKSAGAVIFRKEDNKFYYLLLQYKSNYWGFPKGLIEKGETLEDTARREVREETGLKDIKIIEGFKEWIKYFYQREGRNVFKIATYLLAETKQKDVKISWEHIGYQWLPYKKALEQLTFKNSKKVLKKANDFLMELET